MKYVQYIMLTIFTMVLLIAPSVAPLLHAQQSEQEFDPTPYRAYSMGGYGSFNLNQHSSDLRSLPTVPSCCPTYNTGTGTGLMLGGLIDVPVASIVGIQGRVGIHRGGGLLRSVENETVSANGEKQQGLFEHTIASTHLWITAEPLVSVALMDKLKIMVGPTVGLLLSASYEQAERILEPSDAVFENNSKTRAEYSGEIPETSKLGFGISGGVRYELPLSGREWSVAPEVFYTLGLNNLQQSQAWKMNALRFGVSVQYNKWITPTPPPPPPPPPPEPPVPPPPPEPVLAARSVRAVLLDAAGKELKDSTLVVTSIVSTNLYATLNYVFFDDSSSVIPSRYTLLNNAQQFDMQSMNGKGTLEIYHNTLNIIGSKLAVKPSANLTLTGCNSNTGAEKNNIELSRARAQAVKSYLENVWKISPDRITIKTRNLPEAPSNPTSADGIEENRRVELTSNDITILEPLFFTDTTHVVNGVTLKFQTDLAAELGVKKIELITQRKGQKFENLTATSEKEELSLKLEDYASRLSPENDPLDYYVRLTDESGKTTKTPTSRLSVKNIVRKDKRVEKFSLIIFAFDDASFTAEHNRIIDIIKTHIAPNSEVSVEGHTDRSGEAEHNQRLSQQRAKATARALKVPESMATGFGSSNLLYPNDTPEGRLYCRTVLVTVETPLEE